MKIKVWICPTTGCGNYYGSSNDEVNLHESFTGAKVEDRAEHFRKTGSHWRHNRAECPDCRQRGESVQRELTEIELPTPEPRTPTPALPVL